ncbi:MAG TPA: nitrophenyl compound nitroreductase subunit ArsF family protein [Bacteroidales bacterium]|nr:nitrophenyl compound nitroreductase subunit ArsF family protein [Bacteroidales bacterium]
MKNLISIVVISLVLSSIGFSQTKTPKVIVYYFHATERCHTCKEIGQKTKMVMADNFRDEIISGVVKFQEFDYEDPVNKSIVNKYFAYGSTLLLVYPENEEKNVDLTEMAFQYVVNKPEKFKEELAKEIDKLIMSD